ncbi:MAG: ABC transporter permease, partial [Saprospiraceae bacterium]|nr:ABC transporter permease [Saprospiraceae bacterium]
RIEYVKLFSVIALFILFIACINFMNLSTARAERRAKEVGVKKVVGATRRSLIAQYLTESTVISFVSMMAAYGLVALFIPEFNLITDKEITLGNQGALYGWSFCIALVTGLMAGSYPALYLSGFKPQNILKGQLRGSLGELWIRRGLVVFQFTLSITLVVAVIVISKQIDFVQTKNLGYDKDNVVYFEITGQLEENLDAFIAQVKQIGGVVNASSVGHDLIGRQNNTAGLDWKGKNPEDLILFENVRVNYDLIETMNIEMKEGRSFSRDFGADTTKIIFNEAAIKIMNLEQPIGEVIRLWDQHDLEIVGVVKDFNFQSLHENVNPLFFHLNPRNTWNIMVRIGAGKEKATLDKLSNLYGQFNPGFPFDYDFLDDEYAMLYAAEQRVASLAKYFAGFAILISCLGLFGLAAYTAQRRIKEVGIRKILGSTVGSIILLLSKDFTRLVIVAILISLPLSYLLVQKWLSRFAYKIDLEIWYFASAGLLALVIAWLTVASQALRAAHINPVECLKVQ